MNPLPQRKKSAEEIAKLRESFGVPAAEAAALPAVDSLPAEKPAPMPVAETKLSAPVAPAPPRPTVEAMPVLAEMKEVRSLKRSERVPVLHPEGTETVEKLPAPAAPVLVSPQASEAKVVRSLRKSEQGPVSAPRHSPRLDSSLPAHRHSDEEINRIRRMEAIGAMSSQEKPPNPIAHPLLIVPGYLLTATAVAGVYFFEFPLATTAACAATALLVAILIFIRKPLSRHHAAFITVAVLLIVVFGALHYFPQIQHGT
ncbi:MAG: hypothetical protein V4640_05790 [Verrucomicrobiota bacterium]